jgi:hypothetical protein
VSFWRVLPLGRRVAIALVLSGSAFYACSSTREPRPVASLASTAESGVAFQAIREGWLNPSKVSRAELRTLLEQFVAKYPKDGLVPVAHAYLAFIYMDASDFARADAELRQLEQLPPGTTADLATTARARWLRLHQKPTDALKMLLPNVGKNVDPIARNLFQEELALSALASDSASDQYEAIAYMDAWLQATSEEEKDATRARVVAIVEKMPREVLEGALRIMRAQGGGYGTEIAKIVAERLAQIAVKENDAELARTLLDADAGAIPISGDAGVGLSELATSRRGLNVVEGRTIGLLLPTEEPALRDESADVLRGVMWALGKPKGIRQILPDAPAQPKADPKKTDTTKRNGGDACLRATDAPDATLVIDEPKEDEGLTLVTRDDSGSSERTEAALDELAGQGAAMIIAALDPDTADRVLKWSSRHDVPVIVLAAPVSERTRDFAFVLGEPRGNVLAALLRDAPDFAKSKVAPVVDASEVPQFPAHGGAYGPMTILPPVSCDTPTPHAGDPRFPLVDWERAGAKAWLVTGAPSCARDLLTELGSRSRTGTVGMTLEATGSFKHTTQLRALAAGAGVVPVRAELVPPDSERARFIAAYGASRLTWHTALGRDAATLARRVALTLPSTIAATAEAVAQRRDAARRALATARAKLWSTDARGFDGKNAVTRMLCVVE